MSSLIKFSIKYAGVIIGLALIVVVYGIVQIKNSPLNVFPEFSPTQVVIQTESPGFSSDLVEKLVTRPIEVMVSGTIGIKQIRSQSIPGLSVVTVVFNEDTDIQINDLIKIKKDKNFNEIVNSIKEKFKNINNTSYADSIENALTTIKPNQGDIILITGSLYLAGEVLNRN